MAQPTVLKTDKKNGWFFSLGYKNAARHRLRPFSCLYSKAMRVFVLGVVFVYAGMAQGQIYQWRDEQGNLHFSDSAPDKSHSVVEQIDVGPVLTVPAYKPSVKSQVKEEKDNNQPSYQNFQITQPAHDSILRANAGDVSVTLSLDPPLRRRDNIVLFMDGKQVAQGQQTQFQLANVDRGTHSLYAEIKGLRGDTKTSTDPVSFTLIRISILSRPSP